MVERAGLAVRGGWGREGSAQMRRISAGEEVVAGVVAVEQSWLGMGTLP